MSERVEIVATIYSESEDTGSLATAREALEAADAVMFSERAIERAAKAMFAEEQCDRRQKLDVGGNWRSRIDDRDRDEYRRLVRAVVAALRGEG